ncbi:glycoside hydrolase family 55 protein [Dothidotthia symphoricarpi CBS 119687]|uniref:Glycoside hydrolase family 55 protein n=1 Tax=Dothidotthia symphoricarpi CBS 119687 TaxID=1392245 RepID=A0A6A6A0S9_9PLEO|nr:glycoside hydrolase family 55 protein [Dothidotthia symphoricarpi CBS 119687]KAF2125602.1 glycoside hydrolase family 55 protein [Dothidotthia symphoricarpi CBS 119687]
MPLAPGGDSYKFFRNVKDYGAKGDGTTDDTEAINRAASEGNRCGQGCAGTSTLGALVYFPPGTYLVSEPIIQYYYTQFVGNPNDRPVMKADREFRGIAIFDTDPYIPGANGAQWYINQNQFFRQIRNFVLDMRDMKPMNYDENGQGHVPVGIHWQVAQATSLQNIKIQMRDDGEDSAKTAIGIFTENGSGGFISDLEFAGGYIGYQAGSQQFTIRNLNFTKVTSAIQVTWTWGMTWQQITVDNCTIGFNITGKTPDSSGNGQGVGSLAIIDSSFTNTDYSIGMQPLNGADPPELVLDNVFFSKTSKSVGVIGKDGEIYLKGPGSEDDVTIKSWALGTRYASRDGKHEVTHGLVSPAPDKPSNLTDTRADWIVLTDQGVANDGTGDQTDAINKALSGGRMVYFPAGIYQVKGTVNIPTKSVVVGSGWSQIRGTGDFFSDANNPKPMVQVGKPGDKGTVEISDMLFTVKGPTAGAVLMEWNIKESSQGSAAMWDSHFRIGGAGGSDLSLTDCPQAGGFQEKCMAASMLLHVTEQASGYFENVWAWTADHDIDAPLGSALTSTSASLNIFSGRGMLIESKGPTWLYGTASEHNVLYQYELSGAENIYMGHLQTETPYFQPAPNALQPFPIGKFPADPNFKDCVNETCKESWGLRIIDSRNVFIYSAGMYSFFNNYGQGCIDSEDCQERLFRIERSKHVWIFNIFTKGTKEVVSSFGEIPSVPFNFTAKSGFTSEIGVYLPYAGSGSATNTTVVFVDPSIWTNPKPDVHCAPPCIMVLPPSTLSSAVTVTFPPLTTTLQVGWTTTVDGSSKFTTTIETTTITIPAITTSVISYWNYNVTSSSSTSSNDSFIIFPVTSIHPPPFTITETYPPNIKLPPATRTIFPPPWPYSTASVSDPTTTPTTLPPGFTFPPDPTLPIITTQPRHPVFPVTTWVPGPTVTIINGKSEPVVPCWSWFIFFCPPDIGGWVLSGWDIGIYPPAPPPPPGPPPGPNPPPAISFQPIPWPEITIGPDHIPTYLPHDPDDEPCETEEAELCTTTVSIGTARRRNNKRNSQQFGTSTKIVMIDGKVVKRQQDATRTTTVASCLTVTGCHVRGTDLTTTTVEPTATPAPYIVYPASPIFVGNLRTALLALPGGFYESVSPTLGTMFFFMNGITAPDVERLQAQSAQLGIQDIYMPHGMLTRGEASFLNPVIEAVSVPEDETSIWHANMTEKFGIDTAADIIALRKRAEASDSNTKPEMAALSWGPESASPNQDGNFYFDDSLGEGTFLYSVDWGASLSHTELSGLKPSAILVEPYPPTVVGDNPSGGTKPGFHGTCMLAKMAGKSLGSARKATVSFTAINYEKSVYEHFIDALLKVHDDIAKNSRGKKSVVNMSLSFQVFQQGVEIGAPFSSTVSAAFVDKMAFIIRSLIAMGVVVTTGSGNRGNSPIDGYPAKFKDPTDRNHIPDLIVVGSTTYYGQRGPQSQDADYIDIWAPGQHVTCTDPELGVDSYRSAAKGTSISSAVVAGLAAYLRGLNPALTDAHEVASLIKQLGWGRPKYLGPNDPGVYPKMVWNGQTNGRPSPCIGASSNKKRQDDSGEAESCILPGNGGSSRKPLTFSSGAPSPTCTGNNCGSYCTGFFCSAPCSTSCGPPPDNPTQTRNPDFLDPANPDSCQNTNNPNFGNCEGQALIPPCQTTTISGTVGCYTSTSSSSTPPPTPDPTPPPAPAPPPNPTTPLEMKSVVCNNEANFPGHADINPVFQSSFADRYCEVDTGDSNIDTMGPGDPPLGVTRSDTFNINYFYQIQWLDGCQTTVARQDVHDPLGDGSHGCPDILNDAFSNCNNGGVGGYIDVGCLRYEFDGGF